ncbi:DUF6531 domain-containing protein [Streptomyces sp. NPDC005962]|uniref:DUF6531 domain-containing protein n=1 Tax=Streptomyces sp. NPDC005962 TaxID=3154466 RepID=UPI0033E92547
MEDWRVLDLAGDPVPGDPTQIRALAARLKREAEHAEQHTNRLHQVVANSGDLRMQGDYAPRFLRRLAELPDQAARLGPAHQNCGNALAAYAENLEQAKIQSRIALSRGLQADSQYKAAVQQFYSLVPVTPSGSGLWRGLNRATAGQLSQYQRPEIRQMAVQIGSYAGQAEQERQAAVQMVRAAARVASEAEASCAQAIRVAAPRGSGAPGLRGVLPGPGAGGRNLATAAGTRLNGGGTNSARTLVTEPRINSRPRETRTHCGDPVDVATGYVTLTATDVTLPSLLPLVFTRGYDSSHTTGRWFGPSWISTADQRLEIDAEGAVFVSEDGLLLAYPHPAPGVPTLPESGPRWPLERDANGEYTLTDPETGRTRQFTGPEVDGDGIARLEQISDRRGQRITFEYDSDGTPVRIAHSGGYELKLTTADSRITALHLARAGAEGIDQELVRYGYTDGNLTEVINSSGLPLRFAYDDRRRIVSWTDTSDHRFDYVYDELDRCVAQSGEAGHVSLRIAYDGAAEQPGHRVTTVTTTEGSVSRYLVNERRQVVAETDPLGHTVRTEYDRFDRVLSRSDPVGHTTTYEYDESGHLTAIARPDGPRSTAAYNDLGLPITLTGPDGVTWHQTYDEAGRRTSATDPEGHTTYYTYDTLGHLSAVTDALGHTTRVGCDEAGLPIEITDPLGATTTYHRDAFGRPVTIIDPLGATTHLTWSVEGKLTSRTAADGSQEWWTYDGEGNCTTHTDAMGDTTVFEYTHFDLLAARTGPDGVRYEFQHDASLRLTQVTNPQGLTWSYEYDPAGRLTSETDFDDRTVTYEHDAAAQLIRRTNPLGQSVTYEHNTLGQITRKSAEDQVTSFTYDPAGRLTTVTGPETEVVYQHDRLGRIQSEMVNGRVLAHSYDPLGRRTRRVTPTGATTTYAYDAAGNRTSLTAGGHTLASEHDATGRETTRRIGDTLTVTNVWDPLGRLTEHSLTGASDASPIQHRVYTYRADGNVTAVNDRLSGPRTFDLDAAGRVTTVRANGWTETYAYDEAGNQTQATWPTNGAPQEATGPRTYTGARITRAGAFRYQYDDAGRLTLRQKTRLSKKPDTWHYTWDAEDRLTSVTTPDGTVWRYLYDPFGRRTAKQRLAADSDTVQDETDFTWDGSILIEQTTTTPDLPRPVTLTWDHDGLYPVAQTERITEDTTQREIDARFFAVVTDLVGTPTELVDESGTIAWHTRSTLWGTTTWTADSAAYTPLRFPGQYFDPETGLHYNFHRYYDPASGRYITTDPLGLEPAPNPRGYVANPHREIDPLGLSPCINAPVDDLFSTATASTKGQLTAAGRALQKHGDPSPGNIAKRGQAHVDLYDFGQLTNSERSQVAEEMIEEILTNPSARTTIRPAATHYGGIVRDVRITDGWGARWSLRGGSLNFEGFL